MPIFSIIDHKAKKIIPTDPRLEKDVQKLFEGNLDEILNIHFLASEYSTNTGRIDTLGLDNNGAPVIIEYKKSQNENVINQGLSYLKWLLDHKDAFEKLVSDKLNKKDPLHLFSEKEEIDWGSPRVICVAPNYNKFDLDTVEILPINIELLKYQMYGNDLLLVQQETQQKLRISTSKVFNKKNKNTSSEKSNYTLEQHLRQAGKQTAELFQLLKEKIMSLDDSIVEEPKAKYIAYKLTTNFVDVVIKKGFLKIFVNIPSGKLNDPFKIARDLTKPKHIGHWGNGDYEFKLDKKEDFEKVFDLIKQSYVYNK